MEYKNTAGNNKSKASIRTLYVLWQGLQKKRFNMSIVLEYVVQKVQKMIEIIKYIIELRKVDKEMRQRASETKALEEFIEQRKKELPEVWGE